MKYRSTRSHVTGNHNDNNDDDDDLVSFEQALLQGYCAKDGGLFVPDELPRISPYILKLWSRLDFPHLAVSILRLFIPVEEIPNADLHEIIGEYALDPTAWNSTTTTTTTTRNHHNEATETDDDDEQQQQQQQGNVPNVVPGTLHSHIPVRWIGTDTARLYVAELFHGPTHCFKDFGLRALVGFATYFAQRRQQQKQQQQQGPNGRRLLFLAATTGDTGPAAVQAVLDVGGRLLVRPTKGTLSSSSSSPAPPGLVVHYPLGHVTPFQLAQMTMSHTTTTLDDDESFSRVRVVAYPGGGDDMDGPIQHILQQAGANNNNNNNNDSSSSSRPILVGVNSYNIGRPLMQLVHFVWTYLRVVEQERRNQRSRRPPQQQQQDDNNNKDDIDDDFFPVIDFVVPTCAMGNLVGGYMAKLMGVPIGVLNCGVNINDVTHQILTTGHFPARQAQVHTTLSEALNLQGIPYNMERILYYLSLSMSSRGKNNNNNNNNNNTLLQKFVKATTNKNTTTTTHAGATLFSLAGTDYMTQLQADFGSARITDVEVCDTIRWCYHNFAHYHVDPHTAVGLCAALKLGYPQQQQQQQQGRQDRTAVLLATASPCKFQHAMTSALGDEAWQAYRDSSSSCPESARTMLQWQLQLQEQQEQLLGGNNKDPAAMAAQAGAIVYRQGGQENDDDDNNENNNTASLEELQQMWEQQTLDLLKELNDGMPVLAASQGMPEPMEDSSDFAGNGFRLDNSNVTTTDPSSSSECSFLSEPPSFNEFSVSSILPPPSMSAVAAAKAAAATSLAAAKAAASSEEDASAANNNNNNKEEEPPGASSPASMDHSSGKDAHAPQQQQQQEQPTRPNKQQPFSSLMKMTLPADRKQQQQQQQQPTQKSSDDNNNNNDYDDDDDAHTLPEPRTLMANERTISASPNDLSAATTSDMPLVGGGGGLAAVPAMSATSPTLSWSMPAPSSILPPPSKVMSVTSPTSSWSIMPAPSELSPPTGNAISSTSPTSSWSIMPAPFELPAPDSLADVTLASLAPAAPTPVAADSFSAGAGTTTIELPEPASVKAYTAKFDKPENVVLMPDKSIEAKRLQMPPLQTAGILSASENRVQSAPAPAMNATSFSSSPIARMAPSSDALDSSSLPSPDELMSGDFSAFDPAGSSGGGSFGGGGGEWGAAPSTVMPSQQQQQQHPSLGLGGSFPKSPMAANRGIDIPDLGGPNNNNAPSNDEPVVSLELGKPPEDPVFDISDNPNEV